MKVLSTLALGAALAAGGVAMAEEAAPNSGALSFSGGNDFVTEYYSRGVKSSPAGFIAQPWVQVDVKAYQSDALTLTPYLGTWNNVQDNQLAHDGTHTTNSSWFESDIYGGSRLGLPGGFTLTTVLTLVTYPGHAADTYLEGGLRLDWSDQDMMKKANLPFTINPYIAYYRYLTNDAPEGEKLQYLEIGCTPTIALGDTRLVLTLPVALGFSPDGTYEDSQGHNESFGFWSIGAFLSYPLPFPAKFGSWTLTGGATYIKDEAFTAQHTAYGDENNAIVGKLGVSFSY